MSYNPQSEGSSLEERQAADPCSPWWGEHVARYRLAVRYANGGSVLDVACGTGYGLPLLSESCRRVVGVDVDASTLSQARRSVDDAHVLRADGRRLPFADSSFSLITSFETIEHLEHRDRFLAELRRVLAPGGTCLVSTPNAHHTRPVDGKPRNPFHVYEYTPAEFASELAPHFSSVSMVGQVLDGRFAIPPFWDDQQRLSRTPRNQAGVLARRLLHRLPPSSRDRASRLLWGHAFFPEAADFHFDLEAVDTAPVVVAICRTAGAPVDG